MNGRITSWLSVVLMLFCAGSVLAQSGIIVNLNLPPNPWADSNLDDKLNIKLSTIGQVEIIRADNSDYPEPGPLRTARIDDLISYGQNLNGRFLIDVFVDRVDMEKRKSTILPCTIFRYQVYGVMTGVIRIIDIKKARLVKLMELDCSVKASDRWQIVDDDEHDADLKVAADKKIILFDRLEEKVAQEIYDEVKKLSKGNHFGD